MRKLFVAVAALGMLLTSCAKDESAAGGNAAVVSFNVAQPTIASRVLGTQDATEVFGKGFAAEDLEYAIYEAEVDAQGVYSIRNNGQEPIKGVKADFFKGNDLVNTLDGIRLVRGKHYIALFFAQSDAVNGNYKFDSATKSISLKNANALKAQDESLDAFFARVDFAISAESGAQTVDVELKRPFAQVNVLTDDAVEAQAAGLDVYQSSIVVNGVYTSMNLLDGTVEGETTLTYDMAEVGSKYMEVNATKYDLLSMNYLLVNARKTVDVTFKYNEDATVAGNDNTVFTAQFDMVPVERNYRTNIIGSILTSAVTFKVVINPTFDDVHGYDPSKSAEELLVEAAVKGGTYTLGSDVQLTSTLVVDKNFTLDLNGKTLTNSVAMRSAAPSTDVIVVKEGAKLTIEGDGVVEAVSGNDGYAVIAEGEVVINGGTFKAGVDADGAANAVIYARGNGKVYVNGGYFPNDANSAFVLNKKDADRATTTIEVKGGKFVNFNPANNAAENAGTNFMAYGYTTEAAEVDGKTVYTVVEIEVTPIATPVVEAAVESKVVTLTWNAVEGAAKYEVVVDDDVPTVVEGTTFEFTGDWDTEYTFSVKAIAADAEWHTDSAAAEVKATTEAEPADEPEEPVYTTVADFLAADVNDATFYTLKGTITRVANTSDGNFDLTDETGTIYVYGLYSEDGATDKYYWAASGAKLGDDIVISAVRAEFNGSAQAGSARFVELITPGTIPFWSFSKTATTFTSAGGEQIINIDAYNLTTYISVRSDNEQFEIDYADGELVIVALENTTTETITGKIYVTAGELSQVIEVSQVGVTVGGGTEVTAEKTMADCGWANAAAAQEVALDDNVTVTFAQGKAFNPPAYYTSGNAVRLYQNGATMTVTANGKTIKSMEITFAQNHYYMAPDCGEFSAEGEVRTWTGDATEVKFTTTGTDRDHRAYIAAIKVTYVD